MSKSELLHELYNQCKDINFDESSEILLSAKSDEETEFFRIVKDSVLQQK